MQTNRIFALTFSSGQIALPSELTPPRRCRHSGFDTLLNPKPVSFYGLLVSPTLSGVSSTIQKTQYPLDLRLFTAPFLRG